MKKIFSISIATVAILTLVVACNKDVPTTPGNNPEEVSPTGEAVTIKATLSDVLTRVDFTPTITGGKTTAMALAWAEGDKIRVFNHDDRDKYDDFTLAAESVGEKEGVFTGTPVHLAGASSYDVEVINVIGGAEVTDGIINGGYDFYDNQTQPADGDPGDLKYFAKAKGLSDYTDIQFSEISGVLAVSAKLPQGVAGTIKSVDLIASEVLFPGGHELTITLTTPGDADEDDILNLFATLDAEGVENFQDVNLIVRFHAPESDHKVYTRFVVLNWPTMTPNNLNTLNINASKSDKHAGKPTDDGSEDNPYLIADKYQMKAMRGLMPENETTHFKLLDDIDLENEVWTPLNYEGQFTRGIYFDGQGHTIFNLTSTNAQAYPSFVGVVNGSVKNLFFDSATITGGDNVAGVLAGYVGSGTAIFGNISGITVKNSTVSGTKQRLGGIAGYVKNVSETIDDCHVINTTVESAADRVGGLFGQFDKSFVASNCTAEDVSVHGTINIGGLVGVGYGNFTDCTSSGTVSSTNTTSNADIALGGLVGYFENGLISHCSSSVNINQTTNGRDIGGLIGKMLVGTVEKSYSTGNVKGLQRNVGGFIGLISNTSSESVVRDCYCTGNVVANAYSGGFLGLHEKGVVEITNCYATGSVEGAFALGGMLGVTATGMSMSKSVGWNSRITASSIGSGNWSSGAVVGVTFPTITLTDNYRNPAAALTVWWVPDADYDHPDVSATAPLVIKDISTGELRPTTATGTGNGNDNYPQFAYHGKVEAGKTLSQLASTTLGWSSEVWDFSGDVPTLK